MIRWIPKLDLTKPHLDVGEFEHHASYLLALSTVAFCTLLNYFLFPFVNASNLIMLYLLGVVFVASINRENNGPAILAALLSTLAFDFFFIPPYLSFNVSDVQYFITLVVMLVVTQTISHLTTRVCRHQEAIRKTKIQAESEKLRNIFLTSISHDMRTPLTVIMGSSSTLLELKEIDTEIRKELAKNIYDESMRLNRIVNNVLQIIRLESGAVKLTKHLHAIDDIIHNVIERLADEKEERNIKLYMAKRMALIPLDHILIEQVFINLLSNAIKYSPNNTFIEVSARIRDKDLLIKILDYGAGINPADLDSIFQKFYRGKTQNPHCEGFGLGLAICKNIINAHGGKIWAENSKDAGAIFYFTLPLSDKSCR